MDLQPFLQHPSFQKVIEPTPYKKSGGPLDEVLQELGTGGFGGGLLFVCDPSDLEPTFRTWVPNPRNPMVPFARTAFFDIFYAAIPEEGDPSPGILDVHYRTMRPAYATNMADFFVRVVTMDDYRAEELRQARFDRASEQGTLSKTEMYAFTPALALGGAEDGPVEKVDWAVHLDLLLQVTA